MMLRSGVIRNAVGLRLVEYFCTKDVNMNRYIDGEYIFLFEVQISIRYR